MKKYSFKHSPDRIRLLDKYEYPVLTTLKLKTNGSYFLKFEFTELHEQARSELKHLGKLKQALPVQSDLLKEGDYGITHVVVINTSDKDDAQVWRCHSYRSLLSH